MSSAQLFCSAMRYLLSAVLIVLYCTRRFSRSCVPAPPRFSPRFSFSRRAHFSRSCARSFVAPRRTWTFARPVQFIPFRHLIAFHVFRTTHLMRSFFWSSSSFCHHRGHGPRFVIARSCSIRCACALFSSRFACWFPVALHHYTHFAFTHFSVVVVVRYLFILFCVSHCCHLPIVPMPSTHAHFPSHSFPYVVVGSLFRTCRRSYWFHDIVFAPFPTYPHRTRCRYLPPMSHHLMRTSTSEHR